ncbi:unnamed protein product [Rotaria socialis]|uniref:Tetraspanin n=1 Tax=Rotaria socialis TaxID=392032 RepID=A0A821SQX3_9BILA|nr:unnamed protein product [Rotaria socialis]CAF4859077.1 unnamed protein product [Rotaria socialis]
MPLLRHKSRSYILYSLTCLVITTAAITFILSLYRLQRDASLLNRERKRDYVTNKINKSFPTIAIIMSIIICLSSILAFIAILTGGRMEMLITSIVSNIILGIGLIVLSVIMLGFVKNIIDNFPIDIERLLVDFIIHNKTSARDELLKVENSNDCCTTQDLTWTTVYSQAAECNRKEKYRMIYADLDEQRGCVKIIIRTALSFMPVLISELTCGCLCLLLGLWTIYITCHLNDRYKNSKSYNDSVKVTQKTAPLTKYSYYQKDNSTNNMNPEIKINHNQPDRVIDNDTMPHHSSSLLLFNKVDKPLYGNIVNS